MKKLNVLLMVVCITVCSCATIAGGKRTAYQRTKPSEGQPKREVRTIPLVCNILFCPPGLIIDFATGHAYRREPKKMSR